MKPKIRSLLNGVFTAAALVIASAALSGCVNVPKTTITGTIDGTPFALSSPKDSQLQGLEILSTSNGVHIHIDSVTARMNPDVITMTGDAQVKIIKAVADGVGAVAGAAASSAK